MDSIRFPEGKTFAFTILDDVDIARVDELRPIYDLLTNLGMRTTKTVWPLRCSDHGRNAAGTQTLEDPEYRDFVLDLRDRGFEIAWHGAAMESNTRERTLAGMERFREVLGHYPRVHANHSFNRENLYGGQDRVDQPLLKAVVQRAAPTPAGYFLGHIEDSAFFWGDVCYERIQYVPNLTFDDVNLSKVNPSMPYRDEQRPYAPLWFSCSDADDCAEFNHLLRPDRQEKLQEEGGWCIVNTHLEKGFVRNGQVDRLARKRLESLVARGGWYVPVGTLLDYLREQGAGDSFSKDEWDRMQWKWARDLVRRRLRLSGRQEERVTALSARQGT